MSWVIPHAIERRSPRLTENNTWQLCPPDLQHQTTFLFPTWVVALTSALAITAQACTEILGRDLHSRDAAEAIGTVAWGYEAENGPLSWFNMNPKANFACGRGTKQTPIDVTKDTTTKQSTAAITMNYGRFSNVKFESTHHTAQVQLDINNATKEANTLSWPGSEVYYLAQFHFHTPSEHRINNEIFPMEVHFVHKTKDGSKAAVVGYLIEIGCSNDPIIENVLTSINAIKSGPVYLPSLDLTTVSSFFKTTSVNRYIGSLTTPPCSEGLEWFVVDKPLQINEWTYKDVKTILGFNSRYTQADPGKANLLDPVRGGQSTSTTGSGAPVTTGGSGH
ncbi:alpha carbonic anhydrase [Tricladium varicosporioides]|nr:alpha carbonic anhydrase [Hymenoscyphus varicosporioides]